jgi:hypothetical protein
MNPKDPWLDGRTCSLEVGNRPGRRRGNKSYVALLKHYRMRLKRASGGIAPRILNLGIRLK